MIGGRCGLLVVFALARQPGGPWFESCSQRLFFDKIDRIKIFDGRTEPTHGNNQYRVESLVCGWVQSIYSMIISSQMVGLSTFHVGDQMA